MNNCMCCTFEEGDTVAFRGGTDEFQVRGHAKTQPKVIIEVDGEAVYVPVSCLRLVRRASMTTAAKLEHAIDTLRTLLRSRLSTHIPATKLRDLLQELEQ